MSNIIEVLKLFFAAINRNDLEAVIRDFDPQIVRIEPEGFPTAGSFRGIAEVREHLPRCSNTSVSRSGRMPWRGPESRTDSCVTVA